MWIFDRSRTTYAESVNKFVEALKQEKADRVVEEISRLFGVSIEAAGNTYATPIFHLGVGYKVVLDRLLFGRTEVNPRILNVSNTEYRYTEAALLLASGVISLETFLLMNIIRFQVLNSTLERSRFQERLTNQVLPLLLTLQCLRLLENHDKGEAYLCDKEIGFLYQKTNHDNLEDLIHQIIDHRENDTPAPPSNNADAFFSLFDSTGVVVRRTRVTIRGLRKSIIVLSANRSMVVDRLLAEPPEFFPITWDDRWRWAQYYSSLPQAIERFIPPSDPFVFKVVIPQGSSFDSNTMCFISKSTFVGSLKAGDFVVFENPLETMRSNVVYQIIGEPSFLISGDAAVYLKEAYRSLDPYLALTSQF